MLEDERAAEVLLLVGEEPVLWPVFFFGEPLPRPGPLIGELLRSRRPPPLPPTPPVLVDGFGGMVRLIDNRHGNYLANVAGRRQ